MQRTGPCFRARRTAVGRTCQITLTGECDFAAVETLQHEVDAAFAWPLRWLVLDLSDVQFLDASGARAVLAVHVRCLADGIELRIVPGPSGVQRVFEMTRTAHVLPFAPPRPPEATDALDATTAAAMKPPVPAQAPRRVAAWRAAVAS